MSLQGQHNVQGRIIHCEHCLYSIGYKDDHSFKGHVFIQVLLRGNLITAHENGAYKALLLLKWNYSVSLKNFGGKLVFPSMLHIRRATNVASFNLHKIIFTSYKKKSTPQNYFELLIFPYLLIMILKIWKFHAPQMQYSPINLVIDPI